MCPILNSSFMALGISVVVAFIFGALWYGPFFGKKWAELAGLKMDEKSMGKPPVTSLVITLVGTFLTVTVLASIIATGKFACSFSAAFWVWAGFYVPLMLGSVIWERRPWGFFGINATYAFLNLQLIATVLTYVQ